MNKIQKIITLIKFSGIIGSILYISDKFMRLDKWSRYVYHLLKKADKKDYPYLLEKYYKIMGGGRLDLNNPKTFNEKIQWLKLYDATPLKTQLADKYLVRDWLKKNLEMNTLFHY